MLGTWSSMAYVPVEIRAITATVATLEKRRTARRHSSLRTCAGPARIGPSSASVSPSRPRPQRGRPGVQPVGQKRHRACFGGGVALLRQGDEQDAPDAGRRPPESGSSRSRRPGSRGDHQDPESGPRRTNIAHPRLEQRLPEKFEATRLTGSLHRVQREFCRSGNREQGEHRRQRVDEGFGSVGLLARGARGRKPNQGHERRQIGQARHERPTISRAKTPTSSNRAEGEATVSAARRSRYSTRTKTVAGKAAARATCFPVPETPPSCSHAPNEPRRKNARSARPKPSTSTPPPRASARLCSRGMSARGDDGGPVRQQVHGRRRRSRAPRSNRKARRPARTRRMVTTPTCSSSRTYFILTSAVTRRHAANRGL
jgi:hypothetical protein